MLNRLQFLVSCHQAEGRFTNSVTGLENDFMEFGYSETYNVHAIQVSGLCVEQFGVRILF